MIKETSELSLVKKYVSIPKRILRNYISPLNTVRISTQYLREIFL